MSPMIEVKVGDWVKDHRGRSGTVVSILGPEPARVVEPDGMLLRVESVLPPGLEWFDVDVILIRLRQVVEWRRQ